MKRFFTFFLILFSIHFEGYSSGCGIGNQALNADGTFESLAGVASDFSLNGGAGGVNGGGWTNGINSADSWITPLPNVTFANYAAGMTASPDGGIFAAIWTNPSSFHESFFSTVTGLTIGKKYTLKFYLANAGMASVAVGDSAQISVSFGSETKLTEKMVYLGIGNQVWTEITMEFFPTSATQQLLFKSINVAGKYSYMGIDGIRMTFETDSNNNGPLASDDGNLLDEGGITSGNVLINDSDIDGDLLQVFSIIKLPDNGSITTETNGDYVYQHDGSETFSDLFTYVVTDGECYDTADVVLSINPVNDAPVVVKDTFYVNEGDTLTVLNSDPN
jgi:VCBS repeat-containing protein